MCALIAKPVGSPKVTGVLLVPAVAEVSCGAGAMPQLNVSAVPAASWESSEAISQVPMSTIAACCLPNSAW